MTPDTVEDGRCEVVGKASEWGREILRRRGGLRKGHFGARVEEVWMRRGWWGEGIFSGKGKAGERKGQQPVLDDHSTHYSTDAAADPVGKEDPFSFTRRHPPGPALLRVLAPHLPAISGGQGRISYVKTNEIGVLHLRKVP